MTSFLAFWTKSSLCFPEGSLIYLLNTVTVIKWCTVQRKRGKEGGKRKEKRK